MNHDTPDRPCRSFVHRAAIVAGCALPMAEPVVAQEADPMQVVVTAQRRLELLKDVPQAVSAHDGRTLSGLGITAASDLVRVAPGVGFGASVNVRAEGFQIRGVGTATFSDSVEKSVGIMVDGVSMARSGQASGSLLDVDRVEILRGPQGVLFGRSTSAGLIAIHTRRPRPAQTYAEGWLSYGDALQEVKSELVANVALGDGHALRLAYGSTRADGYVRNVFRGETYNGRDERLFRAKALLRASDALEILVTGDWGESRALCCAPTARTAPAGTPFATLNAAAGIVPGPENEQVASNSLFTQRTRSSGLAAEVGLDLGVAELRSITAYREWAVHDNNDPDLLPVNFLDVNSGETALRQTSQELRLTSTRPGRLDWLVGLYAARLHNRGLNDQTGNFNGLFTAQGVPPGADVGALRDTTTRHTTLAAYGQVGWRIMPALKVGAGLRYSDEQVEVDYEATPTTAIRRPGYPYLATRGEARANNVSWRLTGQWEPVPDTLAYVTAARGFKGPAIDILGVTGPTLKVIGPEIPRTLEAGLRAALAGGRVVLHAVAFKTRFDDFQAQVFDQSLTPAAFRLTNAGRLDTEGVELEWSLRPHPRWTVRGALTYLDAVYGRFENIACYTGQPILPFGTVRQSPRECIRTGPGPTASATTHGTGNPLTNAPRTSASLAVRHAWPMAAGQAFGELDYFWRDKAYYSAAGDPVLVQPGYGVLGGSVGWTDSAGRWQLALFGRNLLDRSFVAWIITQPVLNSAGVSSQFTSPHARRSVGVQLSLRFGG